MHAHAHTCTILRLHDSCVHEPHTRTQLARQATLLKHHAMCRHTMLTSFPNFLCVGVYTVVRHKLLPPDVYKKFSSAENVESLAKCT